MQIRCSELSAWQ